MKPPAHVEFREDLRLLIWKPHGVVNENAVNRIIKLLGQMEASSGEPFNRFTDALAADAIDLNFRYIFQVSLFRRLSYSGRPAVKSAILAQDASMARYGRMHAMVTQGSPLKVRVFEDRAEVAKWLGVSKETLE